MHYVHISPVVVVAVIPMSEKGFTLLPFPFEELNVKKKAGFRCSSKLTGGEGYVEGDGE